MTHDFQFNQPRNSFLYRSFSEVFFLYSDSQRPLFFRVDHIDAFDILAENKVNLFNKTEREKGQYSLFIYI